MPTSLRVDRGRLIAVATVAPVAVAVFADGGYGAAPRVAFGAMALASLAAVVAFGRGASLREPLVLVLLALAAVGALSAAWTIGPVDRTLRWALVSAGYAAVVALSAEAARRHGVAMIAGAIGAVGLAAAAGGLLAAVTFEPPYATRSAGAWRPGGPFEYPPALALLQVSALPAFLAGMMHRSRALAGVAALGMAFAGGVLALSASRLALALALTVAGLALCFPGATARASRPSLASAFAVAVAAGLALQVTAGPRVAAGAELELVRVAALACVAIVAPPAWLFARAALEQLPERPSLRPPGVGASAVVVTAAAAIIAAFAFGPAANRGAGPPSDFLHGRLDTWSAGLATWADRPLGGAGADAFLAGSARHQGGETILFAHQLPLEFAAELGVAGLALALALYVASAGALWRARRTPAAWLLGPAVAAFLAANLVDWQWHLAGAGAIWALAAGAVVSAPRSDRA